MSTLTRKERQRLIDLSEPHYLAEGYHTLEHRNEVMEDRRRIGCRVLRYGFEPDDDIGDTAAAWHDAAIALIPKDVMTKQDGAWEPASCSEEVASAMFDNEAQRLELPEDFRWGVRGAIMGTSPSGALDSLEAKLLAAADTKGVGFGSYEQFVGNTHKLWHEAKWRGAKQIDWEDFVVGSINYLGLFMSRNIHLTPEYLDGHGRSAWHLGAVNNILRLANETWVDIQLSGELTEGPRAEGQDWITARNLDLNLSTSGLLRKIKAGQDQKPAEMKLSLPVEGRILPLEDQILDRFFIQKSASRSPQLVREAGRVLKDTGALIVGEQS